MRAIAGSGGGGGGSSSIGARMLALGQDACGLPAKKGLTHHDFRAGDPVVLARTLPSLLHATPHHNSHHSNHLRADWLWLYITPLYPLTPPFISFWQVAVRRTSGQHTVGRVAAVRPGWVQVVVERSGLQKDVQEGDVYRLLGGLTLA